MEDQRISDAQLMAAFEEHMASQPYPAKLARVLYQNQTEEAKKVPEDAKKVTEDANKVTEDAKKVTEDDKKVTEDANKLTEDAKKPKPECGSRKRPAPRFSSKVLLQPILTTTVTLCTECRNESRDFSAWGLPNGKIAMRIVMCGRCANYNAAQREKHNDFSWPKSK